MSEWQPIETAPKNGTKILLFDGGQIYMGMWRNPFFEHLYPEAAEWLSVTGKSPDGRGSCVRMEMRAPYDVVHSGSPTHWQALPAPPD